jgi:hypothetical protein
LADVTRKAALIRQEINSRNLRTVSTEQLHALLKHLEQKLQDLEAVKKTIPPKSPIQANSNQFKP